MTQSLHPLRKQAITAFTALRQVSVALPRLGHQRHLLALLIVASAVVGLACAQDVHKTPVIGGAVVPFEMLPSNHMMVNARLNAKDDKTYRLIFDLGSPMTLLSSRAAEAAGAIPKDAPRAFLFGIRGEGSLAPLHLGDLKAEKVPVIVMDHPALKALGTALGKPLDGILGYTFFARYKTTIDYQARQMTFTPVAFEVRDFMKEMPQRMLGPKAAKTIYLTPAALWGFSLGNSQGGVSASGIPVISVVEGSPAAIGGLKVGDLLTALDGRWTTSVADAYKATTTVQPGQSISAVVVREGKELTLSITPSDGL